MCYWKTELGECCQGLLESYFSWSACNSVMMTPIHRFFPCQTRLKEFSLQKSLHYVCIDWVWFPRDKNPVGWGRASKEAMELVRICGHVDVELFGVRNTPDVCEIILKQSVETLEIKAKVKTVASCFCFARDRGVHIIL